MSTAEEWAMLEAIGEREAEAFAFGFSNPSELDGWRVRLSQLAAIEALTPSTAAYAPLPAAFVGALADLVVADLARHGPLKGIN